MEDDNKKQKDLNSVLTEFLEDSYSKDTDSISKKLDPLEDNISSLELIRVSGSDLDIVNAARVSYGKVSTEVNERDEKLINYLMQYDHTSPFEHNQLSFRVKCPIYVSRQWMRHRMNSYNEISYRYVKADLEFYIPKNWRYQDKNNKQGSTGSFVDENLTQIYKDSIEKIMKNYELLLEKGVSREQARGLLPLATYTEFIYTCNLHSLMHFLKLRLSKDAQYEIRAYAKGLLELAKPHFPVALNAWQIKHGIFDII
ncbi:FAD-dependent thymidylate synthase [Candidatus Babela massiliensis]|uniref:Flavin-dependent thymidylate synthase n=1 Tax=Candidatus Babela massiliensis TaxID=673862 RepID=V6DIU3_9BACT|nr:FAD-dependent thymidylate synthase [Candidatus Babela massiliensis]CDK30853.1 Thymidylate synthase [Candidatus Babela massiliensis]